MIKNYSNLFHFRFNLVNKGFAAASTVSEAQKLTQRLEEIKKAKQAEGSTVETEEEKDINAKLKKATLPMSVFIINFFVSFLINLKILFIYLSLLYFFRMSVMWSLTTIDIESTLQKVCTKVTHDNSVSPESRLLRKRGLVRLGEIYYQKGQETIPKGGIEDILVQVNPITFFYLLNINFINICINIDSNTNIKTTTRRISYLVLYNHLHFNHSS